LAEIRAALRAALSSKLAGFAIKSHGGLKLNSIFLPDKTRFFFI
jgi:hypothetical protein